MRYFRNILFVFVISLTYLFFIYDFTLQNILVGILFYMVYYAVNVFIILSTLESKIMENIIALLLIFNYAVCCYSESFLLGLPLLFLIAILFYKKYHFTLKMLASSILVILILSFLVYKAISPSISVQEISKVFNSDGDIAVVSLSVDAGATGIDYKYIFQKVYLRNLIRLEKTIKSSNKNVDVQWISSNSCRVGDVQYKVCFP